MCDNAHTFICQMIMCIHTSNARPILFFFLSLYLSLRALFLSFSFAAFSSVLCENDLVIFFLHLFFHGLSNLWHCVLRFLTNKPKLSTTLSGYCYTFIKRWRWDWVRKSERASKRKRESDLSIFYVKLSACVCDTEFQINHLITAIRFVHLARHRFTHQIHCSPICIRFGWHLFYVCRVSVRF